MWACACKGTPTWLTVLNVTVRTESPVMHACAHDIHMTVWVGTARPPARWRTRRCRSSLSAAVTRSSVTTAPSGKEALALLRTKANLREYFDVVLLDQDMPGMTGMQLAAKIKEDPSLNHDILVVMLTGYASLATLMATLIAVLYVACFSAAGLKSSR